MLLFVHKETWRNITESLDRWNFESLHMLFVICTCDTTFSALLLQENYALVFSQSEACNFFMYIIKHCNNLVKVFKMTSWSHLKHLYIEEIKSNPQVYTTLESIREIKSSIQVYTTQEGIRKIQNIPQIYTTQGSIREIKNNPQVYTTKRVWKSNLQVKYNT